MMDYDIQKVKMIISDVDGVWTDGSIYKGKDGIELKPSTSEIIILTF
jgi:3-deoxy-D-manno-octulosonate 8-phosphate phosphatase KdsC-like HAD superfamily phosphatase